MPGNGLTTTMIYPHPASLCFYLFILGENKLSLTLGPKLKATEIIKTDISRVKRQVGERAEKGNPPAPW